MTQQEVLRFLRKKKKKFREAFNIEKIGIFGSYSRSEQKEESDIDIVYLLREGGKFGYFDYLELQELLTRQFGKRVELVNYRYMNPLIKYKAEKEIIYV